MLILQAEIIKAATEHRIVHAALNSSMNVKRKLMDNGGVRSQRTRLSLPCKATTPYMMRPRNHKEIELLRALTPSNTCDSMDVSEASQYDPKPPIQSKHGSSYGAFPASPIPINAGESTGRTDGMNTDVMVTGRFLAIFSAQGRPAHMSSTR